MTIMELTLGPLPSLEEFLGAEFRSDAGGGAGSSSSSSSSRSINGESSKPPQKSLGEIQKDDKSTPTATQHTEDGYYFDSYSGHGIHVQMLQDEARTNAYQEAIFAAVNSLSDRSKGGDDSDGHRVKRRKVESTSSGPSVLDVGGGTGILSLFAAKAGASKVYAIELADIAHIAKKHIHANGFDNVIRVLHGRAEEVELVGSGSSADSVSVSDRSHKAGRADDNVTEGAKSSALVLPSKVDILVSEWMGYFLLYESMLDSVIYCRDKFLKPGGLMLPNRALMFLSVASLPELWNDLGKPVDIGSSDDPPVSLSLKQAEMRDALNTVIDEDAVVGSTDVIADFDLQTCTVADVDFSSRFEIDVGGDDLKAQSGSESKRKRNRRKNNDESTQGIEIHAFVGWFQTDFIGDARSARRNEPSSSGGNQKNDADTISLSTSPGATPTHWKQTVFFLEKPIVIPRSGNAESDQSRHKVVGNIDVRKARNNRDLQVTIDYRVVGLATRTVYTTQVYALR